MTDVFVKRFGFHEKIPRNIIEEYLMRNKAIQTQVAEGGYPVEMVERGDSNSLVNLEKAFIIQTDKIAFHVTKIESREDGIYCTVQRNPYFKDPIDMERIQFFFRCVYSQDTKEFRIAKPVCFHK